MVWCAAFLLGFGASYMSSGEIGHCMVSVLGLSMVLLLVTLAAGYVLFEIQAIKDLCQGFS